MAMRLTGTQRELRMLTAAAGLPSDVQFRTEFNHMCMTTELRAPGFSRLSLDIPMYDREGRALVEAIRNASSDWLPHKEYIDY